MRQATIIKLDDYRLKRQGRNTPLRLVQRPPEAESPAASRRNGRFLTALAASILVHAAVLLAVPWLSPAPESLHTPLLATIIVPAISQPAPAKAPSASSPEVPREKSVPPPPAQVRRAEPARASSPASRPSEPRSAPLPQVMPAARSQEPPAPPATPSAAVAESAPAVTASAVAEEGHAMPESAPPLPLPAPATAAATGLPAQAPVAPPRFDAAYLHNPRPAYPRAAIRLGLEGEARIDVLVGPDGKPQQTRLVQSAGHEALDQSALDAVARWRFVPARRGDEPVAARVEVPVRFQLDGDE